MEYLSARLQPAVVLGLAEIADVIQRRVLAGKAPSTADLTGDGEVMPVVERVRSAIESVCAERFPLRDE